MATGFMAGKRVGGWGKHSIALAFMLVLAAGASAQEVGLAGLMGSKAMLMINGGEPRAVAVGQTIDGVKLLAVQGDRADIEIGGKKRSLRVGQHAVGAGSADGGNKIVMTADGQGHFFTNGSVNGSSLRFMVDTGATSIAIGASDARRLRLNLENGQRGMVSTANGNALVTRIMLDSVRIGDVLLHNVEAVVLTTEMPAALLGMSFLNRMEMVRDGNTMTLKKRF